MFVICPSVDFLSVHAHCCYAHYVSPSITCFCFAPPSAGDISGAVQTLRSLLLFYPSDKDSLDNLQLYSETLGGDTESQGIQPTQVPLNDYITLCNTVTTSYNNKDPFIFLVSLEIIPRILSVIFSVFITILI